jgi:hypothetical protein
MAHVARKCKVLLLASDGVSNSGIAQQTGFSRPTVIATRIAFERGGVEAIGQRQKREPSAGVRRSEAVTLRNPVMPVTDGFSG